jgi:hypothetical protein
MDFKYFSSKRYKLCKCTFEALNILAREESVTEIAQKLRTILEFC